VIRNGKIERANIDMFFAHRSLQLIGKTDINKKDTCN
jgi:hypothetical protein